MLYQFWNFEADVISTSNEYQLYSKPKLTRALLGLWISHRLLGGGGRSWGGAAFERPPMISAPGRRREKRKAAFESSRKNHFEIISVIFFAQVKIGVSRGQNSKIFQNGFSTIKSLILKIEQRIWYHRVCLVKARRTIYKITLKGQGQSLTSCQVRRRCAPPFICYPRKTWGGERSNAPPPAGRGLIELCISSMNTYTFFHLTK